MDSSSFPAFSFLPRAEISTWAEFQQCLMSVSARVIQSFFRQLDRVAEFSRLIFTRISLTLVQSPSGCCFFSLTSAVLLQAPEVPLARKGPAARRGRYEPPVQNGSRDEACMLRSSCAAPVSPMTCWRGKLPQPDQSLSQEILQQLSPGDYSGYLSSLTSF